MKKDIKSLLCIVLTSLFLIQLTGCVSLNTNSETETTEIVEENTNTVEENIPDVKVIQENNVHYIKADDGQTYGTNEGILVLGFNNYRCVDTNLEYNEETDTYTCTVEYKRIIKE